MKKSFQVSQPLSTNSDSDNGGGAGNSVHDQCIVVPTKFAPITESIEKKERSWLVTSQIPTDLTIQIQDITFYVHKYPLLSRSGYMSRLTLHASHSNVSFEIDNFPGGPETFELILKFCYGLPIDLTPTNIAPLRCASEFLEMTEDLEEGNLISKSEAFLTFAILSSWKHSIAVLNSCNSLSPWADSVQIVRRCSESIAWKAYEDNLTIGGETNLEKWWFDDLLTLGINNFVRIVTTLRAKGLRPEIVGGCIAKYAVKWLPGFDGEGEGGDGCGGNEIQLSILSGRGKEGGGIQNKEQRMMIESLVSILPPQREAASCGFLLWLLKMAIVYSVTPALVSELEKRAGMVLEDATVSDLLIPNSINGGGVTLGNSSMKDGALYDVDVVQRIVEYFLMHEKQHQDQQKCAKIAVGKLLDTYLAEIARDPNLSNSKFQVLAETLPENARMCDDGLYRAIDTYLKLYRDPCWYSFDMIPNCTHSIVYPPGSLSIQPQCCKAVLDVSNKPCWHKMFLGMHLPVSYADEVAAYCKA
ncbi:phototropic-responsive NPH3 family protein isoform X2 [Tasmannia lanceolata]|uniref:phototropic-responsive NPH3 family protein isoform X2 n=1 Tax=Tasmannia lanceolata TaxID=3420 RepID=UPI004062CD86